MQCFECFEIGAEREAIGLCHHCAAALCAHHAIVVPDPITTTEPLLRLSYYQNAQDCCSAAPASWLWRNGAVWLVHVWLTMELENMRKKRILFLCTGNSARSQMAEGLLRHLANDRFEVFSAGTHPVGLNPNAVSAMSEIGIDISAQRSKSVDEFLNQSLDYVFTVCDSAKESCPFFPGAQHTIHHSFEDPAAEPRERQLGAFRKVRDQIRTRLEQFVADEGN